MEKTAKENSSSMELIYNLRCLGFDNDAIVNFLLCNGKFDPQSGSLSMLYTMLEKLPPVKNL